MMPGDGLQALLARLGLARPQRPQPRQENQPTAWHQLPDIVRHIQSFLDTRDVLSCDAVSVQWRAAQGRLGGVHMAPGASKKANKAQRTFLASHAARLQAVSVQLEDSSSGATTQSARRRWHGPGSSSSSGTSSKHAERMAALVCQATAARSLQLSSSSKLLRLPDGIGALQQLQVGGAAWCCC